MHGSCNFVAHLENHEAEGAVARATGAAMGAGGRVLLLLVLCLICPAVLAAAEAAEAVCGGLGAGAVDGSVEWYIVMNRDRTSSRRSQRRALAARADALAGPASMEE